MSHDRIEVSRTIAADPTAVWSAVTDITRMGEWSPECHTARWVDGASGPATGAWFEGENRNGDFEWTTRAVVVECEQNRRFVFEGDSDGFRFSRWGCEIEPTHVHTHRNPHGPSGNGTSALGTVRENVRRPGPLQRRSEATVESGRVVVRTRR